MPRTHHSGVPAFLALLAMLCFSSVAFAAGVVTTASESSLVAAMTGGGTVTFSIDGTIYLTNTIVISENTVLDATGYNVAISGSNAVQIFVVNAGVTLAMTNLTVRDGLFKGNGLQYNISYASTGGAISNAGALEITDCSFENNHVEADTNTLNSGAAYGGAIYNAGSLALTGGTFQSNSANGVGYGTTGTAGGGAIYNAGTFIGSGVYFNGNWAVGDSAQWMGSSAGPAYGGAIDNAALATFASCVFSNNSAFGGPGTRPEGGNFSGSPGGAAGGGALCNSGTLVVSNSTFAINVAAGGQGGTGGSELAFPSYAYPGGTGGAGGGSGGGGVCCVGGSAILVNDTFCSNSAIGGLGGTGGAGTALVQGPAYNGGNGGQGGSASGGASFCNGGTLRLWNVTAASNSAAGGTGGAGGPGGSAEESAPSSPGSPGPPGTAAGDSIGNSGGSLTLLNSLFVPNNPSDTNMSGSLIDEGHNIDSIAEGALTNATSLNGVNPGLAPLANNGGPTPTMALLPGSPAIDAADLADFPATDQRGVPRPFGPAPDIGAFEYSTPVTISGHITGLLSNDQATVTADHVVTLTTNQGAYSLLVADTSFAISPSSADYVFNPPSQTFGLTSNQIGINFQAYRRNAITLGAPSAISFNFAFAGTNGQEFRVETSTNFTSWTPMATNTIGAAGYSIVSFPVNNTGSHFFRLVSP